MSVCVCVCVCVFVAAFASVCMWLCLWMSVRLPCLWRLWTAPRRDAPGFVAALREMVEVGHACVSRPQVVMLLGLANFGRDLVLDTVRALLEGRWGDAARADASTVLRLSANDLVTAAGAAVVSPALAEVRSFVCLDERRLG